MSSVHSLIRSMRQHLVDLNAAIETLEVLAEGQLAREAVKHTYQPEQVRHALQASYHSTPVRKTLAVASQSLLVSARRTLD